MGGGGARMGACDRAPRHAARAPAHAPAAAAAALAVTRHALFQSICNHHVVNHSKCAAPCAHLMGTSKSQTQMSPSLHCMPRPRRGSQLPSSSVDPTIATSWPKLVRYGSLKESLTFLPAGGYREGGGRGEGQRGLVMRPAPTARCARARRSKGRRCAPAPQRPGGRPSVQLAWAWVGRGWRAGLGACARGARR